MLSDGELLRRYAEAGSEESFTELVRHHVDLVYSAALRQVNGNAHLAQDVSQSVFADLARKARALSRRRVLTGWLYTSTRFAAAKAVRKDRRRHTREQKAETMRQLLHDPTPDLAWEELGVLLDEAMNQLKEADREAILLRYFENRPLAAVGARLGLSENAARMRVDRAVEKLRTRLSRRGITTVATALTSVISVNAVQVAPAGLAATLAGSSIAGAAGAGTGVALLQLMVAHKATAGVIAAIMVTGAATTVLVQGEARAQRLDREAFLRRQTSALTQLGTEHERLTALAAQAADAGPNTVDALEKLRNQAALLREQTNVLASLESEHQRLLAQRPGPASTRRSLLEVREDYRAEAFDSLNRSRNWMLAFIKFADLHQGQLPTNFGEAFTYLPDSMKKEAAATTNEFEIVYQGSWSAITNPSSTIVLREKQARASPDGKWAKTYSFADGHSEVHSQTNADFTAWEQWRNLQPQGR